MLRNPGRAVTGPSVRRFGPCGASARLPRLAEVADVAHGGDGHG